MPARWLPWHCHLRRSSGFSSVFSASSSGAVCRSLMLFKIKVIVALPGEQRGEWQRSWHPSSQDQSTLRTLHPYPPEAAGTVEVSIAASTAQGSILIADTAPGEFFFLSLGPRRQRLGLQEERNGGSRVQMSSQPGARLWEVWQRLCGAFLTSVSALLGWARGRGAASTGMLKPLASSRAASSVSCEDRGRELLPALSPGSPPGISDLTSQLFTLYVTPAVSSWFLERGNMEPN